MNNHKRVICGFLLAFHGGILATPERAGANPQGAGKVIRVYVTDSQSWEVRGGWAASGGTGSGSTAGGARPQTAEIIKTFGERCPDVTVTNNRDKANYAVILDHEGGKGLAQRHNKIAVFNRDGDSIFSHSTVSLGNAVKDACDAIRINAQNNPQSLVIPASTPAPPAAASPSSPVRTAEDATGTVNVNSTPDGGEVYVDNEFVGDSPAALKLTLGKHLIRVKMPGYQDWEREMAVSGGTVNLNAKLMQGSSSSSSESAVGRPAKSQAASTAANVAPRETQYNAERKGNSGWIGVTTNDDASRGVVITKVLPNSSASQAGLQVGDVIVELNGKPVKSGMEFDVAVSRSEPGSQVRISYMRGSWRMEVKVTVGKIA